MLECFTKCKCFKCCFCLDHEIGVILVGVFYILVTVATCAWQYFEISIPMMYWQALSLIKNIGLIMGVRRKNVEYFLPWLVVIVVAILIGPFVIIGKFLQYKETRDDILGPVILGIGMPLWVINMYLWTIVFSLFIRYSDTKDPISPKCGRQPRKNKNKNPKSIV